ncbi:MAG: chemotaxis protein CheD [Thermodesulfobacteriota bacterium]
MNPLHSELPIIFLKPAEVYLSDQPVLVTTTLGSCVSIIFFDPGLRLGAISHALLPTTNGQQNRCKYVDGAFFWMLEQFQSRSVKMDRVQVKLFGGADLFEYDKGSVHRATIGQQNIKKALELVRAHGLNLKASHLGGEMGQKIFFFAHCGKVLVKKIEKVCWLSQEC